MGDHSESLYLHLHKQINDETCLSEMFNSERRLDLFANNYSMISTYYDQMENDPTSEQALTKWSFLDFTLAICRNLTKLHADSVPLTESETKLSLSCATCLIKSGSELHYETMIDTLINKSNFAFLDKVLLVNQIANKLIQRTQAESVFDVCVWMAFKAFDPTQPLESQTLSRVMHGLVITLKGIGPLIGTFSLLIRDFRLKAMQPLEANSPISSPKSMNSKSEDQFLLELILCLTTVLTEDVQQLQSCCDHLNVHDCCRTLQMAMLNKTNAILRKRARHAALTLNWIDATCWQLLEALEESQVHLCKPVLDRLLIEWAPTQTAELTLSKLELVLQRMFDHTNKAIKRYALNYLSQLFTDPLHFESKISASFVFGHVFAALQDNQVYGDGLAERSLCFVNRYNVNDVLNSLLLMQSSLSPFSLFYVTRDLNTFDKIDQTPFSLEPFRVQQLMQSIQRVCAEPIVRAAIQLQLLKAVIERAGLRSPCTSEMNSLTTLVGCLNLKEVKVAVFRDFFKHWPKLFVEMTLLQQSDTEMKSAVCDLQIAGIARLLGAHFCANLTAITRIINQEFTKLTLNAKQIFIQNLLLTLHLDHIEALDKLLGLVMQPEFLHLLQPLSDHIPDEFVLFRRKSKSAIFDAVEPHPFPRLYTFLESQFNGDPFLVFDLITKLCFSPDVFESHSKQINQDLIDLNLRFELTRDLCWTWLIEHLDYPIIWKQCKPIFSNILGAQDDKDNTIDLIQIVPTHLNSYVIQVYGKLLRNEIACLVRNPTTRASLSILNNFEAIFSQLFKSCLELRKKEFYRQTFYALISEFAFAPYLLCLTADQLKSIGIEDGAKDYRLNRFAKVESAEVQAFLIDHVSRVMSYDFKRFHLNKPDYSAHEELLFQITVDGILFERKQLNLMQMLIERVSNDVNIFEHILCTESPHFHRNVRCQAIVASFSGMQLKVTKFQNRLVQRLIQREINLLSEDGVKSFPHSRIHRQQTKIWQYFTLLSFHLIQQSQSFWEPVVSDSDKQTLQLVYEHTIRSILDQTAAQLSVRHLQSVLLICLLESPLIGPHFVAQFRCTLEDLLENRSTGVGCFQTLLCVLYHLIPSQPTFDFFPIGCLLSCHHYRVRLFSHLVMQRLEDRLMITFNDHGTRTFHTAPKAAANFTKNLQQLRNDWFFAHLNVSRDLCCLLILEHLPRLTDCLHDDLLFAEQFCGRSYDFRIELSNERLIEANPSRLFDRNFDQPNSTIDQSEQCALVDIFQRKCMIPVFNQSSITTSTQRICGNLIICASLIDRAPNLGGLSRTSEIFGVHQLVVPNLYITQDKDFQGLSVSAYKWLPMSEVPVNQLISYLTNQRNRHGYTLIGIEQSTGSVCLTKFSFPDKSLLVLGNEKEGLPADLLQIMDFCIEIPQCGQTRSLNVHVTGAICAWEYMKQHRSGYSIQRDNQPRS